MKAKHTRLIPRKLTKKLEFIAVYTGGEVIPLTFWACDWSIIPMEALLREHYRDAVKSSSVDCPAVPKKKIGSTAPKEQYTNSRREQTSAVFGYFRNSSDRRSLRVAVDTISYDVSYTGKRPKGFVSLSLISTKGHQSSECRTGRKKSATVGFFRSEAITVAFLI